MHWCLPCEGWTDTSRSTHSLPRSSFHFWILELFKIEWAIFSAQVTTKNIKFTAILDHFIKINFLSQVILVIFIFKFARKMDREMVILTWENRSSIQVSNMYLIYCSVRSSSRREGKDAGKDVIIYQLLGILNAKISVMQPYQNS